ncbi:MAG TPA: Gfo/Idh/MocA family oxidoreductase, partial [Geobacteraceae bacterium]
LVAIARREGRILMVGHLLQYHPAVLKLKELIGTGVLGKVQYIYSNRLNIGKLRTEENILWSFAPHDISVLLMLLGEEPLRVTCFGGAYLNAQIYDTTMTTLEFRGGVKGHIFVSWLHPFKEQKLVVVGSRAMAVFDDVSAEKLLLYPHTIEWKEGRIPVAQKATHEAVPVDRGEPLKLELTHFLSCIAGRQQPRTDGEEGLRVLRILEAAERSLIGGSGRRADGDGAFVHESSYVDDDVAIGAGTSIWHFSHLLKGSRIGQSCKIGQNVVIGPGAVVGNNVKIQNNVSVYEGVTLEDHVFCGPSMVFTNVFNPRSEIPRMKELRPTLVRRGATIGANATIVCGNTIGRYAFIGAGAVVTKDVPDYALMAGNPAKQLGWVCRCGTKLAARRGTMTCSACGNTYKPAKGKITAVKEKQ